MQLSAGGFEAKKARGLSGKDAPIAGISVRSGYRDECMAIIDSPASAKHPDPIETFILLHSAIKRADAAGLRDTDICALAKGGRDEGV